MHVITITLTHEEMLRAGDEMPPDKRKSAYLMSQSPLLSTQLCSLFELVSALKRADAKATMSLDALVDDDEDYQDDL
jgi:hypothetical protein